MLHYEGPDPLEVEVTNVLTKVGQGQSPRDVESRRVEFKEEAGRRPGGVLQPGQRRNSAAVDALVPELGCMANTPGSGALVLGIADDGTRIGTELDAEWLRHEIYQKSERQLTVDIRAAVLDGVRILVLRAPEALEPIRYRNKIHWRVNDNCVEVDVASWWEGRLHRLGFDWSSQTSTYALQSARPAALQRARQFLQGSNEGPALELAQATDEDLLRRLNAVTADGMLTNAGALLFVGRPTAAIDYIRRDVTGGDSTLRLRTPGVGLLEELHDVEQGIAASNPAVHVATGLVMGQLQQLPPLAVREAIVNGVVHRDWQTDTPTTVEHTGPTMSISSPGGFIGSVTPANIITHPSEPRYRALAEMMASLRVAEREGIGVDRMVREMIRVGYSPPDLQQIDGPRVRAVLVGGRVDEDWLRFLASLRPAALTADLDALLVLRHLVTRGWIDAAHAAPVLQRSELESAAVLTRLTEATLDDGKPVLTAVAGIPEGAPTAVRLAGPVRARFASRMASLLGPAGRRRLATDWATGRGRISTTELADLVGIAPNAVSSVLRALESEGVLEPSRGNRAGRSFHYLPVSDSS